MPALIMQFKKNEAAKRFMLLTFVKLLISSINLPIVPCKGIQDSLGFWIPRRGFRIPDTRSWILCQWNWDSGFLEHHSEFQNPGLKIPQANISQILDFTGKIFLDSEIQISLHGAIPTCYGRRAAITNLLSHEGIFNNVHKLHLIDTSAFQPQHLSTWKRANVEPFVLRLIDDCQQRAF